MGAFTAVVILISRMQVRRFELSENPCRILMTELIIVCRSKLPVWVLPWGASQENFNRLQTLEGPSQRVLPSNDEKGFFLVHSESAVELAIPSFALGKFRHFDLDVARLQVCEVDKIILHSVSFVLMPAIRTI